MHRVLVLGGTGFIGSQVLSVLRHHHDVRVMVLGHRRLDYRALEDFDLVTGSLPRFDLTWLEAFRPDTILHLARLGGRDPLRRALAARWGRRANERLIRWLEDHAPDTRVIYVSGTLVYGNRGEEPATEESAVDPIAYARQYIRAERPWMEARSAGALPITIVRPPWVVGSGSWFHHYYALPALRGGHVPLYGDGGNWMSFLDVRDCAGCIVHLAQRAVEGKVLNLFAPEQFARQAEFVAELSERTGSRVRAIAGRRLRAYRDPAVREALTSSFVAGTVHEDLRDYEFVAPTWRDMVSHHLPSS